jgi:hypothetical protein
MPKFLLGACHHPKMMSEEKYLNWMQQMNLPNRMER